MQTVTYRVSRGEQFRVMVKFYKVKTFLIFVGCYLLMFVLYLITITPTLPETNHAIWQGILISSILSLYLSIYIILPALVIAAGIIWYRMIKSGWINKEVKFGFSESGLVSETELTKTEFKWELIKKVKIDKSDYWLWLKPPSAKVLFVSKRAFTQEQRGEFEKLIKEKFVGGKQKNYLN